MKKIFILAVMGLLLAFTGGAAGAMVGAELEEGMDMDHCHNTSFLPTQ